MPEKHIPVSKIGTKAQITRPEARAIPALSLDVGPLQSTAAATLVRAQATAEESGNLDPYLVDGDFFEYPLGRDLGQRSKRSSY
jgi:hypothetical protein